MDLGDSLANSCSEEGEKWGGLWRGPWGQERVVSECGECEACSHSGGRDPVVMETLGTQERFGHCWLEGRGLVYKDGASP